MATEDTGLYNKAVRTLLQNAPQIWTQLLHTLQSDQAAPNGNFLDWHGENSDLDHSVVLTATNQVKFNHIYL